MSTMTNPNPNGCWRCFRSPYRHSGMRCIIAVTERIGLRTVVHTAPLSLRHSLAPRIAGSTGNYLLYLLLMCNYFIEF